MVSVAQLVERRIVIPVVAGSNPVVHPTLASSASTDMHILSRHCCRDFAIISDLGCTTARVAELVDALVLGTSVFDVGVRVSPFAPVFVSNRTHHQTR